jgi:acetyltransferase EpsM
MKESIVIYGAGGHASVLTDLVRGNGGEVLTLFADQEDNGLTTHHAAIKPYNTSLYPEAPLVIGIGNNQVRERLSEKVAHKIGSLFHADASIAQDVIVGEGTVVLARAVVQSNCKIGKHVIINAGAVIDHDAAIGDFVHVAANAYVGGGAQIGKGVSIGAGAIIMRHTVIQAGTVIPPLTVVA